MNLLLVKGTNNFLFVTERYVDSVSCYCLGSLCELILDGQFQYVGSVFPENDFSKRYFKQERLLLVAGIGNKYLYSVITTSSNMLSCNLSWSNISTPHLTCGLSCYFVINILHSIVYCHFCSTIFVCMLN